LCVPRLQASGSICSIEDLVDVKTHASVSGMIAVMAGLRINKRQRRQYRKSAKAYLDKADRIEGGMPEMAATLRRIAATDARLGSPPGSRKRRAKSKQTAANPSARP